ncbi:hypothetical protein [Derxia gummosa]|uniref:Cytochrome c domain-containing protein n=1 Tax=Derxia gummosa DSM 723 TaxID=1121388 RepID=A0A8B6X1N3_9BURK|nr:hypothetical protein [Derxia gummosa]
MTNRLLRLAAPAFALALALPAVAADVDGVQLPIPPKAPRHFGSTYVSALRAPLPLGGSQLFASTPGYLAQYDSFINDDGLLGHWQIDGPLVTKGNAFFQSLGSNGRTCATCHQPANAMTVGTDHIRTRFWLSAGRDPLFAPVDGATCPSNVPTADTARALLGGRLGGGLRSREAAYSLLLNKGLFRVFLPVPATTTGSNPHPVEFTVKVVSDPYGCNTDPAYATSTDPQTGATRQIVSVYRRPRMSSNLLFTTSTLADSPTSGFPPIDLATGDPLAVDPFTGKFQSGNIMWDGREPTLESQAFDATMGHAQATTAPTQAQVAEIVAYERQVLSAQIFSKTAFDLTSATGPKPVNGGPKWLAGQQPIAALPADGTAFALYGNWNVSKPVGGIASARAAVARGEVIFNSRKFTLSNVAGFNNVVGSNAVQGSCSTCHNQVGVGSDALPFAQRDIGIGGHATQFGGPALAGDLPVFELSCKPGFSTPYGGATVRTNDPGMALITGKCADIGRKTVPQMRGLAARAPYFSDGSAPDLRKLVEVYNKRFSIGLTDQEKSDLVAFMKAL